MSGQGGGSTGRRDSTWGDEDTGSGPRRRQRNPRPCQGRDGRRTRGGAAILKAIVACVDEALAASRLERRDIAAAGIGSPGPPRPRDGRDPLQRQPRRPRFPARVPTCRTALGCPVLVQKRRPRRRIRRVPAGGGTRAPRGRDCGVCRHRHRRLHHRGWPGGQWHDRQRGRDRPHRRQGPAVPSATAAPAAVSRALASRTAITRRVNKAIRKGTPDHPPRAARPEGGTAQERRPSPRRSPPATKSRSEPSLAPAHYLGLGLGSLINVSSAPRS